MKLNTFSRLWLVAWLPLVPAMSLLAAPRQVLKNHLPPAAANLTALGRLPATNRLSLALGLPVRDRQGLATLLQQIYDPASPLFHHYLTPDEFTQRFGPTESDYQAVVAFAKANGLTVTATYPSRTLIDLEGPVSAIEQTFHVTLRTYQHPTEKRTFYAPDTDPSLDLAVPVLSVSGLHNFQLPHPMSLHAAAKRFTGSATPLYGSAPGSNYWGGDFRAAYLPGVSLNGTGQSVGLVEFDGYYPSDISSYETQAGLPAVPLSNVYLDGVTGSPGGNNDEVSLDIEMAISMAPGLSQVIVYEGTAGDDVLQRIVSDNQAKQISASWTYPTDATTDQYFMQLAAQGQSFFNSSGDSDAYNASTGIPTPCDDTNITIVGGTTLTTSGPGGNWVSETVWNWGYDANAGQDVGTGGGVSLTYGIPYWQQGINTNLNQGSTTMRNLPDVALTADNVWVDYGDGQSGSFGGTSCAAPLWAAFTALVNQEAVANGKPTVGFINPAVYAIGKSSAYASAFHDITSGNNFNSASPNLYSACPGYDLCTGWGTPNGANMIFALTTPEPLQIIPAQGFGSAGTSGGPFSTTNQMFSLTNVGTVSLNWSVGTTSPWLTASPASGSLSTDRPATSVTFTLASAAYTLTPGTYTNTAWFTNAQDGIAQSRQFALQVLEPLQVGPAQGFASTGSVGGPFTITNESLTLSNLSGASLSWTAGSSASWLIVSPALGSLAAGGTARVAANLGATAYSLSQGSYSAVVSITNLEDGAVTSLPFTLQVVETLQVTPAQGFSASGPFGGPYTVTNLTLVLANVGASPVTWGLGHTSTWLNVSSSGGVITAGGPSTSVNVVLNGSAYALAMGNYADTVLITNLNDGTVFTRQFELSIQPIVLNGGFETGGFDDWTVSGAATISGHSANCLILHNNSEFVHSGTYGAALGPTSVGYLSQTLTTAAGQLYLLSLWVNYDGEPNQFQVNWNGQTLYNQTDVGHIGWTNLQFAVQSPGTSTVLELGFLDGSFFLGLDDISVVPVPAPAFRGISRSGNSISLTWGAVSGASYQVQYATSMSSPNWINLGGPISASGSTATTSDTIGATQQRFYRVALVP